jgi:carboxyl-terminal processing protease
MNKRFAILIVVVAGLSFGFVRINDGSMYARIARSLELMGEVFRNVSLNYVEDVDPEVVIEAGINGMLRSLDPYTTYIKDEDSEDIDMLSSGSYAGFGISIDRIDSMLVITNVRQDYPAHRAGLRIGDRIVAVDGTIVDTLLPRDLRKYTRGPLHTDVHVRVVRDGRPDTIAVTMQRAVIDAGSVSYYEVLNGGVAYVKLARFGRRAAVEVRNAIDEMRSTTTLRSIVLDLRDNPGGLLDAGVGVAKLFVPKGSTIVATRGRDANESRTLVADTDPYEPNLPIAVIINERSASAAEIVAGAIQDVDRGIIVGRKSFGKGLVQTVVPLPGDAQLKMTTSRYFTPSGRSIQRIDYSSFRKSKGTPTDTAVFYTRIGRTVRELSGIEPDTILNDVTLPAPIQHLVSNNVLFRFATWYTSNLEAPPQSYDKIVETFIRYLDNVPPGKRSAVLASLAESRRTAEADGYPPAVIRSLEQTERLAEREFQRTLRSHADVLRVHLEREIRHRFEPERVRAAIDLRLDYVVQATSSILSSRRYALFLEQPVAGDQ